VLGVSVTPQDSSYANCPRDANSFPKIPPRESHKFHKGGCRMNPCV
jgi:hypothetical protein